jgi:hypothetical protein
MDDAQPNPRCGDVQRVDPGERPSRGRALSAGVAAGDVNLAAFFPALPRLLESDDRYLLMAPIPLWRAVTQYMVG